MNSKENQTNCEHEWVLERESMTTINGHLPALLRCKKCSLNLTASEIESLEKIKKPKYSSYEQKSKSSEEILKLFPEFHGIGINLKPFFRKIRKIFRKK